MVVNPEGGLKKGIDILEKVKPIFDKYDSELTVLETEFAGHAQEYAHDVEYAGYDGFCAIGGDGTLHEVINGMLNRSDGATLPIGLVTGGTGNSFMYDMDCLDPEEAAKRITQGQLRKIDVAKVDANGELYYAFNIVGWGLVTEAGQLAEKLRWLGGIRYDVASILEVLKGKKRISKLILDDKTIEEDFVFILGCNTIHTGKGMKMAPFAKLDDGKIDLIIVRKASRLKLLRLFPKLFSGEHVKSPLVDYQQVNSFSIVPDEKNGLTIDGELIGHTPVHVEMELERINVLV